MSEWREARLEEVCSRLRSGTNITAKDIHEAGEVPVFGGNGIRGYSSKPNFSGECAIIGRQGAYCGNVRYFNGSARMSEHAVVAVADSANNTRFLAYLLSTMNLGRLSGQAAQPGLSVKVLAQEPVLMPSLDLQTRVASFIGSIDALIENNRRRVEVLEEMARAIYREWFVKFGYPGHEDVPLVDSALGPIPEGWATRRVRDVSDVVRGRSYRSAELVEKGGLPFVNLKCMARGGGFRRDGLKRYIGTYKLGQLVSEGDIVLAVTDLTQGREILARATLIPRLAEGHGVISLDVVRVVPNGEAERLWVFAALGWSDFPDRVKEYANGSTVLHLSPKHLEEAEILWVPEQARKRFTAVIAPMLAQIAELSEQTRVLRGLRDLLLPKLVTGQIDVSSLDLDSMVSTALAGESAVV